MKETAADGRGAQRYELAERTSVNFCARRLSRPPSRALRARARARARVFVRRRRGGVVAAASKARDAQIDVTSATVADCSSIATCERSARERRRPIEQRAAATRPTNRDDDAADAALTRAPSGGD